MTDEEQAAAFRAALTQRLAGYTARLDALTADPAVYAALRERWRPILDIPHQIGPGGARGPLWPGDRLRQGAQ